MAIKIIFTLMKIRPQSQCAAAMIVVVAAVLVLSPTVSRTQNNAQPAQGLGFLKEADRFTVKNALELERKEIDELLSVEKHEVDLIRKDKSISENARSLSIEKTRKAYRKKRKSARLKIREKLRPIFLQVKPE